VFARAEARRVNRQPALAMADLDQALKLAPDMLPALIARAQLRLAERDPAGAAVDLDAASKLAPKQDDQRLVFGDLYRAVGRFDAAAAEYDAWIQAHDGDARMANALFGRCRSRALVGRELDKALADCNRGLRLAPNMAGLLETRGIVQLKTGAYDAAIHDFDAALAASPRQPLALYGRGEAKLKKGLGAEGDADLKAAAALQPNIALQARNFGLVPAT
jgi:tetratricopeptide (TPR) repeat protein